MGQAGHHSCHFCLRLHPLGTYFFLFRSPCMHMVVSSRCPGLHSTCWVIGIFGQQKQLVFRLSLTHASAPCCRVLSFCHWGGVRNNGFSELVEDPPKEAGSNILVELGIGWRCCCDMWNGRVRLLDCNFLHVSPSCRTRNTP